MMGINGLSNKELNSGLFDTENGGNTLYSFNKAHIGPALKTIRNLWSEHRKNADKKNGGYINALGAYQKIEKNSGAEFNDKTIVNSLFAEPGLSHVYEIFSDQIEDYAIEDADSFFNAFQRARMFVYQAVANHPEVLTEKSFPATFFHKDILMMFDRKVSSNSMGMFDKEYAQKRIQGTGEIILRTVYGARVLMAYNTRILANCLMLAEMHNHIVIGRKTDPEYGHRLYNQSSAAFTLLTFSYFIGKAIEGEVKSNDANDDEAKSWRGSKDEAHWYFFWKVLGSTMGVHTKLLPNNQHEAELLWKGFLDDQKILSGRVLNLLVNSKQGVLDRSIHIDYIDGKLCGKEVEQIIELLRADGYVVTKEREKEEYMEQVELVASLLGDGKTKLAQTSTIGLLKTLRHGSRLKKPKVNNSDLIYPINLPHLLDVYQDVIKTSEMHLSRSMTIALLFAKVWPFISKTDT